MYIILQPCSKKPYREVLWKPRRRCLNKLASWHVWHQVSHDVTQSGVVHHHYKCHVMDENRILAAALHSLDDLVAPDLDSLLASSFLPSSPFHHPKNTWRKWHQESLHGLQDSSPEITIHDKLGWGKLSSICISTTSSGLGSADIPQSANFRCFSEMSLYLSIHCVW